MKNLNKYIAIISTVTIIAGVVFFVPSSTFATENTGADKQTAATENQANKIARLKAKGDQEISRRLTALQKINAKIDRVKLLTADQKASFKEQVNKNIADLTVLKAKIDADTDLTILRADVKSITTSYRVFALFIPKIYLLVSTDRALEAVDLLSSLADKLSTRLDQAAAEGKDVTDLKNDLTSMKASIASAKTQLQDIEDTIIPLTSEGYPGNKTTLKSARDKLKQARQNLVSAKHNAKTITATLKSMKNSKDNITTSSSTTESE